MNFYAEFNITNFKTFHKILFPFKLVPWSNLVIGMYWCQAGLLSVSTTRDQQGHKQTTNTGIEEQLIFNDKLLK